MRNDLEQNDADADTFTPVTTGDRRTGSHPDGRRRVVGPYVDVHGTDRYLLTLSMPILADERFLGIVGADLPVARFEALLLHGLGDLPADAVVVNPENRVVLSSSARWPTGSRARPDEVETTRALVDPHWRVATVPH